MGGAGGSGAYVFTADGMSPAPRLRSGCLHRGGARSSEQVSNELVHAVGIGLRGGGLCQIEVLHAGILELEAR